ncbi:MAG: tyrosine-type recombinase/integrase [Deltaproteobacteria bacterium]|nr:tyrosine-type recombinase/integrase [Deltaproteobacteria bacterium]
MAAIGEFQAELSGRAARSKPGSLTDLLTEADAPLFPPLKLWGRNETGLQRAEELSGLSPSGLARMLHRRATFAGHDKDSAGYTKMHPHGLRHLAALNARDRGVDISTIQATMGHSSLAYTGHYLEVRDPRSRSLMPAASGRAPAPGSQAAAPRPSRTIEAAMAPSEPAGAAEAPEHEIDLEAPEHEAVAIAGVIGEGAGTKPTKRGLVGLGQAPVPPPGEVLLQPIHEAAQQQAPALVRETYSSNWGESKGRARTWLQRGSTGLLSHAYVGKRTGLPWWEGAGGRMHSESFGYTPNPDFPAMPIMSPSQLLGPLGDPLCSEQLCLELVALYDRWMVDEKFGPTAAAALSQWVRTAALVTLETDEVLRRRNGGWLPTNAPPSETRLRSGSRPAVLRTHIDGAIISWFQQTAWQYRETGETRVATGEPLDIPKWYRSTDPLGDLSERDRGELLDWLQVWVGQPPADRTARFDGLSRKELGKFLSLLCQYEMVAGDEEIEPELKELSGAALENELQRLTSTLTAGKVSDFSYAAERKARKGRAVSAEISKKVLERGGEQSEQLSSRAAEHSKYLSPHFMALVKKLFGKEAGADPILQLFSLCTAGAPLGREGDKYKGLFRVRQGNIRHTPEFAREFAAATGAHSECVARRLARHLHEEGKPDAWYRRKNWAERLDYLEAMAAYRIPCPQAQEQELAALLPESEVPAVLEQWERGGRLLQQASEPEGGMSEAEAMMQEEQERDLVRATRVPTGFRDATPNRRAAALTRLGPARKLLPNPILIMALSAAMLRARRVR